MKKIFERKTVVLVFFMTFILEMLFVLTVNGSIAMANDHIGEMNFTSYLAGLDWRPVLARSSYYGWGVQWIYTILFKISDSPYVIWYGYWIIAFIFSSLSAVYIYKIETEIFKLNKDSTTFVLAISFGLLQYVDYAKACAFDFFIWLATYYMLKCIILEVEKSSKIWMLHGFTCAFIIVWSKNCHELGVVLFIPFLFLVLYKILDRNIFFASSSIVTFASVYYISRILKRVDIEWLTTFKKDEILVNTGVGEDLSIWFLESVVKFKGLLILIVSNLCTLDIWMWGFYSFSIVLICTEIKKYKTTKRIDNEVIVILFSILCASFVACGVALVWGKGLYGDVYSPSFSGKAYNHVDYYRFFGYPAVLSSISFIRKKSTEGIRKIVIYTMLFRILFFIKYIFQIYINEKHYIAWNYTYIFKVLNTQNRFVDIAMWSFIEIAMMIYVLYASKKEKKIAIMLLASIIALTGISFNRTWLHWADGKDDLFSLPSASLQYCGGAYELIKYIDNYSYLKDKILYIESESVDDYYYPTTLQFCLNRYTIQTDIDKIDNMKLAFGVDADSFEKLGNKWIVYQLGKNEYVATNDKNLRSIISEYLGQ